jgi:hypothetical protein
MFTLTLNQIATNREYVLPKAHAKISVILTCSRFSLPVCYLLTPPPGGGTTPPPPALSAVYPPPEQTRVGRGRLQYCMYTGDRIWSSLGRQKVKRGLLGIIHILWLQTSTKSLGGRGGAVLFSISLGLLQLIARGHCRFSNVRKCCFALCKESTLVLQFFQTI